MKIKKYLENIAATAVVSTVALGFSYTGSFGESKKDITTIDNLPNVHYVIENEKGEKITGSFGKLFPEYEPTRIGGRIALIAPLHLPNIGGKFWDEAIKLNAPCGKNKDDSNEYDPNPPNPNLSDGELRYYVLAVLIKSTVLGEGEYKQIRLYNGPPSYENLINCAMKFISRKQGRGFAKVFNDSGDSSTPTGKALEDLKEGIDEGGGGGGDGGGGSGDGGGGSGDGGGGCFTADTKVLMTDGSSKNIEDVEVGDMVLAFDFESNEPKSAKVLELMNPVREGFFVLNNNLLKVTDNHPIFVRKSRGLSGWASLNPEMTEKETNLKNVMKLEEGDFVFNLNVNESSGGLISFTKQWIKINKIEYIKEEVQTYNLKSVEEFNNFFADGLLVHNKGGGA